MPPRPPRCHLCRDAQPTCPGATAERSRRGRDCRHREVCSQLAGQVTSGADCLLTAVEHVGSHGVTA
eukprot:scaffold11075_cov132-Isochrysis_galbana.AAC.14